MLCALKSIGSALGVENDQTHETLNLNPHRLRHYLVGAGGDGSMGCLMAWIYLAESGDSPSPWQIGSSQLPTVKTIATLKLSCCQECQTEPCQLHPYGMTSGLSEPETFVCASLSTSSMEASRVRTLALQAAEKAWQESEADYFSRSYGSFARYDHNSSSWKMSAELLPMGLIAPQQNFPPFGMIVDGNCSQLRASELCIKESDGFVLPTPRAARGGNIYDKKIPTPSACDGKGTGSSRLNRNANYGMNLRDWFLANYNFLYPPVRCVEWLMGYPIGHTDLKDWAMQWFRSKRGKRSKDSSDLKETKP